MPHDHDHHHHAPTLTKVSRAFYIGIVLNMVFVIIEAVMGFSSHSLSLLSDAGHNLSDVASLILSLLAFKLSKIHATRNFTYGYRKSTVLAALSNAFLLLLAMGGIGYEAILRLQHPQAMQGGTMAVVAGIGIIVNAATALLFFKDKDHDLNMKGAYLHMAADALVSLGVVVAGIVIVYTGWYWLDGIVSLLIIAVILVGTWNLLSESLRLSLDGVPPKIKPEEIEKAILGIEGVKGLHHLHIWALSTTDNACTAHVVLKEDMDFIQAAVIKHRLKHALEHLEINHATIETELENEGCKNKNC